MKYAVYVEGQSELLFVADVLQKYSDYDPAKCGFRCINLNTDDFKQLNHPMQGDEHSTDFYQIVNVNNDNRVVSKLRHDIPGLLKQGYNVVIGLKDVYGEAYQYLTKGSQRIDIQLIEQLHSQQFEAVQVPSGSDCRLHFAIMEFEAWMLALIENFVVGKGLDWTEVSQNLEIDITTDIESSVYHPYPLVKKIYRECGSDYNKHKEEILAFLSALTKADYENLRHSGRCASFGKFLNSLLGGPCPNLP